jgi:hypothetical protein
MEHRQLIRVRTSDGSTSSSDDESISSPSPDLSRSRSMRTIQQHGGSSHHHRHRRSTQSVSSRPPRPPSGRTRSFQPSKDSLCSAPASLPERRPTLRRASSGVRRESSQVRPRKTVPSSHIPVDDSSSHGCRTTRTAPVPVAPPAPRRHASLPVPRHPPSRKNSLNITAGKKKNSYVPRKFNLIEKNFKNIKIDNDVWVERMVLRDDKPPRTYFKSVHSKECLREPPTGAVNILYIDDVVSKEKPKPPRPETQPKKPTRGLSSFWGKKHKKDSTTVKPATIEQEQAQDERPTLTRRKSSIGFGAGLFTSKKDKQYRAEV